MAQFKNLKDLLKKFSDEQACRDYLVQRRWNGTPICPYCGCSKSYKIENGKRFKCANRECHKKYSVTVGTVAEDTNISLSIWFGAIYLISAHKKGISSVQLGKDLGIPQKTSWFVLHRIREALRDKSNLLFVNEVQADETYMGGEDKNRHQNKKHLDATGKGIRLQTPVMGMYDKSGLVKTKVVNSVTRKNATEFVLSNAQKGVTLVTDSQPSYYKVGEKYNHVIINHRKHIYSFNGYTTNGIENYWSILKRGIYGIYHQVSPKHLQRYCDEFAYRFNSRKIKDNERFELILGNFAGRLKYDELTAKPIIEDDGIPFQETGE